MPVFLPATEAETLDIVAAALSQSQPLVIAGENSKAGYGRPAAGDTMLSTRALRGVSLYEPSELVLTAAAGTPLREINALLDQRNQQLAFEPMNFGTLYGGDVLASTLGGAIAVNASGPRRIKAGAARDHVLGFRAISGRAEIFKSGGRVMKNVTGYDMSKLMTGSFGTLAVLTEITVKVLPKAETEETLVLTGLSEAEAVAVMTEASGLPHEVSSFAHLPAALNGGHSQTALRLEGPEVSVVQRKAALTGHFRARCKEIASLAGPASDGFWANIRDCQPLAGLEANIWRISTTPTNGAQLVETLRLTGVPLLRHYYDWAGGLIWLALAPQADPSIASTIRAAVAGHGHATLMRASDAMRAQVPVFHPQPAALAALSARVKHNFDPENILNRGRLREDF